MVVSTQQVSCTDRIWVSGKRLGSCVMLLLALISITFSSALGQSSNFSASLTKNPNLAEPEVLTYRQIGARSLKAYVFRPTTASKNRPAILLFHGGAWQMGDASWMFARAKEFAENGMVAISVDYRLSSDGLSPIDGVEDACAAFTWVRQQAARFGIDPKRVAGYGWSAGGHLVAAAATLPSVKGRTTAASARPNALLMYSPALNMAKDPYFMRVMAGK